MVQKQIWRLAILFLLLTAQGNFVMGNDYDKLQKNKPDTSYAPYKSPPPMIIREQGNRLKAERSVYLKQHAYNPMDWYSWGDEALYRAKAEDKPIFLSIGYASCHWCHMMENEVFTKDDIAEFMNEYFINIKVDREERPDIDAVYMEAVQTMTGGGGWPLSVFLTPDLKPFYGGTYYPHDQFLALAEQIIQAINDNRDRVEETASGLQNILTQNPPISSTNNLNQELIESLAEKTKAYYDKQWGGFLGEMKFPTPVRWSFLLHYYRKTGDPEIAEMIRTTLDKMASGGLQDHIGGGFHRYTVDKAWLVPHFEKMLYDNAQLAALFLEASVIFDDPDYEAVATATLDFMLNDMSGSEGAFYASYDADSEGQEGLFYLWTEKELIEIVGQQDGPILAAILGISSRGNFENSNVLTRRAEYHDIEQQFSIDEAIIRKLYEKYRPILYKHRAKRPAPNLDKKIITSWNGLAISAFANAAGVLNDRKYLEAAENAANYILRVHLQKDGSLFRASYDGQPKNDGILDDYAFLANSLPDLYQASGNIDYLKQAIALVEYIRVNFKSDESGYYLTHKDTDIPMGRKIELFDSVRPSGNSVMVQVLLKVAAFTGNTAYREEAKKLLNVYSEIISKAGLEMAWWLDAGIKYHGPFYELIIIGDADNDYTHDLKQVFWDNFPAHAVLISGSAKDMDYNLLQSAKGKTAIKGIPTAYVCKFGACNLPTSDIVELKTQLMEGWVK